MSEELSALNRQAISAAKRHMGHFAWPTVLFTAATLVVFVGNLVLFAAGVMPLWAAISGGGWHRAERRADAMRESAAGWRRCRCC